jgi:hypothetical protein
MVSPDREGPTYRSNYVVDYEAFTGLSLLRIPYNITYGRHHLNIYNTFDTLSVVMSMTIHMISKGENSQKW